MTPPPPAAARLAVGLDYETELFRQGCMAPPVVCLAYDGHLFDHVDAETVVETALQGNTPLAVANAAYDMAVTCAEYPRLIPLVFDAYSRGIIKDVLIRQKLIDIAMGVAYGKKYSLAAVVKRLARVDLEKDGSPRKDFGRLRGTPVSSWPREHIEYALGDEYWHRRCFELQHEGLVGENALDVLDDEDRQTRGAFALHLASVWGVRTDAEGIERLRQICVTKQDLLRPALLDAGLIVQTKKGITKKKAPVQRRVFEAMGGVGQEVNGEYVPTGGWENVKITKTGLQRKKAGEEWQLLKYVATDKEACRDSGDNLLLGYTEFAQSDSILTGHIPAMLEGITLPIHTRFDPLKDTGRTGSSKPNIQNVRKADGARECIVPRYGYCFVGCDYNKAELHTLAQCCIDLFGWSTLGDALNSGFDPHTGLGARLEQVDYETLLARINDKDKSAKKARDRAKPANFGFPGGMGPRGMRAYAKTQYGIVLSRDEVEELYQGWQEQWPDVSREYLGWIRSLCGPDGFADIKHFTSNRYRGKVPYTVAANSFFQGRAADGAKKALFEVARLCYSDQNSPLFGCRIVNFIHDEILLEVPIDAYLTERAFALRDVMIREFNYFTPDVPVSAEPCAMDRWSKYAETLFDENGRLQIWKYVYDPQNHNEEIERIRELVT